MRTSVKRALGLGLLAGVGLAAYQAWRTRVPAGPRDIEWSSAPFPFPPIPRPATPRPEQTSSPAGVEPSIDPNPDGSCPVTHPVKGKMSSGIYHVPGGANYERTNADRCYVDDDAALRDGLRRSKV
jgi:hypothetical protein